MDPSSSCFELATVSALSSPSATRAGQQHSLGDSSLSRTQTPMAKDCGRGGDSGNGDVCHARESRGVGARSAEVGAGSRRLG